MPQPINTKKNLFISGANGQVGKLLQKHLSPHYNLRLGDITQCDTAYSQDIHSIDILQPQMLNTVLDNIDCVIHLAAIATEIDDADAVLTTNILGTKNMLEATRQAQVPRFILASSIHAVGFYPRTQTLSRLITPRASGFYGVSKIASEALVRLYADKYGLSGICLRINSLQPQPKDKRQLTTWLSEGDAVRLFQAAIEAPLDLHFEIIYGISNNTRKKLDNTGAQIAFSPQDDAENYLEVLEKNALPEGEIAQLFHGGPFTEKFFDGDLDKTLTHPL
ncbi:MAG TPA: NAD(P)-dependent oxidoreductase [Gammaproteobacteria bacterium]|nr:NAD(P)-dependent oxidoreductase [Gammaproteobacteria bacterium]